jgi:hypothetical protein
MDSLLVGFKIKDLTPFLNKVCVVRFARAIETKGPPIIREARSEGVSADTFDKLSTSSHGLERHERD